MNARFGWKRGKRGRGCFFSPTREPGMEACKRDKPMFAGVFGFCECDIRRVCHACKGEYWPMFIVLVTLSRFRFPAAVRTVTAPLHRWEGKRRHRRGRVAQGKFG